MLVGFAEEGRGRRIMSSRPAWPAHLEKKMLKHIVLSIKHSPIGYLKPQTVTFVMLI